MRNANIANKTVLKLNAMMNKQLKSYFKHHYTEREKIQVLNELDYFKKNHFFSSNVNKNVKVLANKILGRFRICTSGTYEERKQGLIDSIIKDMQNYEKEGIDE